MEIRSSSTLTMDSSDSSSLQQSQQKKSSEEDPEGRLPRPISPCDSEISVGCENDSGDRPLASPMDLTEEATEDEEHRPAPRSPSTSLSRGGPGSPQTLSPVSVHDDESESFTYLSEDEYFRPLKRLAMSDTSPPQHPTGPPGHVSSDSMSSPEPSTLPPNRQREDSKPQQSQQKQPPPLKLKLQQTGEVDRVNPLHHPMEGEEEGTTEGEEEVAERENDSEMRERRVAERELQQAEQKLSGLRSFSILDILSYKPSRRKSSIPVKIVRPWDTRGDESTPGTTPTRPSHPHESQNNNNNNNPTGKREGGQNSGRGSALDALFKMTNKTLDNLNKEDKAVASPSWVTLPGTEVPDGTAHWFLGTRKPPGHVKAATFGVCGGLQGVVLDAVNLFNNRQPTKKKRKSRTAFTNHQIFELEKRFLYQKYLSPADRDELAQSLGLSNAQVITWFQNRRAKLKRDMEELKRDVESSKVMHNKTLLEASANVVAFLKAKELPKIHLASLPH